jgi:hypothetical protein
MAADLIVTTERFEGETHEINKPTKSFCTIPILGAYEYKGVVSVSSEIF